MNMKTEKIRFLLFLCILVLLLVRPSVSVMQAEDANRWPTQSMVIDTGWVDHDPSKRCPETHYPVCVEIAPLDGDGARYKAVFIPKPKGDFDYKSVVEMRAEEYRKLNADLIATGFIQISHQVVTLMHGDVHQAVWASRKKGGEK